MTKAVSLGAFCTLASRLEVRRVDGPVLTTEGTYPQPGIGGIKMLVGTQTVSVSGSVGYLSVWGSAGQPYFPSGILGGFAEIINFDANTGQIPYVWLGYPYPSNGKLAVSLYSFEPPGGTPVVDYAGDFEVSYLLLGW